MLGEGEEYPLLHPAQCFDVKQNNFNNLKLIIMAQISITDAMASGVSTNWNIVEGSTDLQVGAGSIIEPGTYAKVRKRLQAGDNDVTSSGDTPRVLEAVFVTTPAGDIKASLLRQACGLANVACENTNGKDGTFTVKGRVRIDQMPEDYDDKKRVYKKPLRASKPE